MFFREWSKKRERMFPFKAYKSIDIGVYACVRVCLYMWQGIRLRVREREKWKRSEAYPWNCFLVTIVFMMMTKDISKLNSRKTKCYEIGWFRRCDGTKWIITKFSKQTQWKHPWLIDQWMTHTNAHRKPETNIYSPLPITHSASFILNSIHAIM